VVSFVTAYIPYLGAVVAGAFAVLIALGAKGAGVAIAMLVVVLLANGLLRTSCSRSRWVRLSTSTRSWCSS
jgi:predicted PurR-regulated permease PerM